MYYYHLLKCIARHYGFSVDTEWQDLSEYHQYKVLYGSDSESIDFSYVSDRGREVTKNHPFEGVIRNLQRRYKETDSQSQRDELAKLMTHAPALIAGALASILRRVTYLLMKLDYQNWSNYPSVSAIHFLIP